MPSPWPRRRPQPTLPLLSRSSSCFRRERASAFADVDARGELRVSTRLRRSCRSRRAATTALLNCLHLLPLHRHLQLLLLQATVSLLSSSSSSFFNFRACWRKNLAEVSSTPSKLRRNCTARRGLPPRCRALCGRTSAAPELRAAAPAASPEALSSVPVGRCATRPLPPPLSSTPSDPVGQSATRAPHHGCDEGPRRAPLRRSAARGEATSAAAAASSAMRRSARHQPPWIDSW